jgi:2-keto-3-deoxy-L-rhamnonate aldolase RhmA
MNPFRQRLQDAAGQALLGTWVMSASPLLAEATGHAGFDWAVLDMEHTPIDLGTLVQLLQATLGSTMVPIVRVPWNDTVLVKRVLDAGATTLLFPFVQDEHEAARAVAATRYPPEGVRGMAGMSRASKFGTVPNYLTTANATQAVIVQLETPQAMDRLEAICAVPGVDAVFIGPADLSATMGYPGQLQHPLVVAAMEAAARRAHAAGSRIGTVVGTVELVQQFRAAGYDFVGLASDLGLYMRAATGALKALRDSAPTVHGGY